MPSLTMALRGKHGCGYEDGGAAAPPGQGQCWVGEVSRGLEEMLWITRKCKVGDDTWDFSGCWHTGVRLRGSALSCWSLLTSKAAVPVTVPLSPLLCSDGPGQG